MTTKKKGMSARVSHVQDVEEITPRKANGTKMDIGKEDKSIPSPTSSRAETTSTEPVETKGQDDSAAAAVEVQKTPEPQQAASRTDPLNEPGNAMPFNAATTPLVHSGRKLTPSSSALQELFDTTESTTPSRAPGHRTPGPTHHGDPAQLDVLATLEQQLKSNAVNEKEQVEADKTQSSVEEETSPATASVETQTVATSSVEQSRVHQTEQKEELHPKPETEPAATRRTRNRKTTMSTPRPSRKSTRTRRPARQAYPYLSSDQTGIPARAEMTLDSMQEEITAPESTEKLNDLSVSPQNLPGASTETTETVKEDATISVKDSTEKKQNGAAEMSTSVSTEKINNPSGSPEKLQRASTETTETTETVKQDVTPAKDASEEKKNSDTGKTRPIRMRVPCTRLKPNSADPYPRVDEESRVVGVPPVIESRVGVPAVEMPASEEPPTANAPAGPPLPTVNASMSTDQPSDVRKRPPRKRKPTRQYDPDPRVPNLEFILDPRLQSKTRTGTRRGLSNRKIGQSFSQQKVEGASEETRNDTAIVVQPTNEPAPHSIESEQALPESREAVLSKNSPMEQPPLSVNGPPKADPLRQMPTASRPEPTLVSTVQPTESKSRKRPARKRKQTRPVDADIRATNVDSLSDSGLQTKSKPGRALRASTTRKKKPRIHNQTNPEQSSAEIAVKRKALSKKTFVSDVVEILQPLDPPLPFPPTPGNLECKWSFDEKTRVLLADFKGFDEIPVVDKEFLLRMMERDDISVVSDGMLKHSLNAVPFKQIAAAFGDRMFHKFRWYDRILTHNGGRPFFRERKDFVSMSLKSYCFYIELRNSEDAASRKFSFLDDRGNEHTIDDALDVVLYMLDCDVPKMLPRVYENYKYSFKMKECLPGGSYCMLHAIPESARTFMGPNMYISPGGGFTTFHQDGSGTVDSGHTCLKGFNEVVMLRRLPEEHKRHAMKKLPSAVDDLPHNHQIDGTFWPTKDSIDAWSKMGYCPSVFILGPGQHLHINKSRLHCFRKLSVDGLPGTDCHSDLRKELLQKFGDDVNPESLLCMSIAFDWMFLGATEKGIAEEVETSYRCSKLCHETSTRCLAVPATTLMHMGSSLSCALEPKNIFGSELEPKPATVCRGILPSLTKAIQCELQKPKKRPESRKEKPDCQQDPAEAAIDPFGSDYTCKLCFAELGNRYFHCIGCEKLLLKDFNICMTCFENEKYHVNYLMHPTVAKSHSHINHNAGGPKRDNLGRHCPCKQGTCTECSYCRACSCKCHQKFQERARFFSSERLTSILDGCKKAAAAPEEKLSV